MPQDENIQSNFKILKYYLIQSFSLIQILFLYKYIFQNHQTSIVYQGLKPTTSSWKLAQTDGQSNKLIKLHSSSE